MVGVVLIARAEEGLRRELVALAGRPGGARRERVGQWQLQASPRLVEERHRVQIAVLAVYALVARPAITEESIAGEQRPWLRVVADVAAEVRLTRRASGDRQRTARARVGLLPQHDVDDACDARRIVSRRRVRNDLDLLDHVRRNGREEITELLWLERTGASVDLHGDRGVAAQADDVVDVHIH